MAASPEQDIAQLEALLRQLEREYDRFLSGQERCEPARTENQVLALVRAYASRPLQNSTLAYRYNSLVARYNAFRTVWGRRQREREEGRGPQRGARRAAGAADGHGAAAGGAGPAEYLASDPRHEQRRLAQFYETYRRLRAEGGEPVARLTPEGFRRTLAERIEQIKREQGCESVLVRVVSESGRTRIVAKPFRRRSGPGGEVP